MANQPSLALITKYIFTAVFSMFTRISIVAEFVLHKDRIQTFRYRTAVVRYVD